jgi:peroxiredoxin (alkyl hydroperoxide reductase subunit C)
MKHPFILLAAILTIGLSWIESARTQALTNSLYDPGRLKPVDSKVRVKIGDKAPDFILRAVRGGQVSLRQFRGRKNVVLSFVPAAWTPVCSAQWPGYNVGREFFDETDTTLLGITVDNIPTLHAWTQQMGSLWFDVLSDFHPHGRVAAAYGVLRSDGTSERALFLIDKKGIIRYVDVHDINERPPLDDLVKELRKLRR